MARKKGKHAELGHRIGGENVIRLLGHAVNRILIGCEFDAENLKKETEKRKERERERERG